MENRYQISFECLKSILLEKKYFYECINSLIYCGSFDKKTRSNCVSMIGAAIRHYLFFKFVLKNSFKINSDKDIIFLSLMLSDFYFTRRYPVEEIDGEISAYLQTNNKDINVEDFLNYFKSKTPAEILNSIMSSYTKDGFLSIRYNVPEWIVGLWTKQYSRSICIKTMSLLSARQKTLIKRNKLFIDEEIDLPEDSFKPSDKDPNLYNYVGKERARLLPNVLNNKLYITNEIENELSRKIRINSCQYIAFYFSDKTNFCIDLMNLYSSDPTIAFFSPNFQDTNKNLKYINKYKTPKMFYEQTGSEALTPLISRQVNTFVVYPKNSNFNYVNSSPEYLLNFDNKALDRMVNQGKQDLQNCSKFVIMGGYLVYFTHTMNRKENSDLVHEFLEKNKNFSLNCEKEFLLSQGYSTFGYYAIMTRTM